MEKTFSFIHIPTHTHTANIIFVLFFSNKTNLLFFLWRLHVRPNSFSFSVRWMLYVLIPLFSLCFPFLLFAVFSSVWSCQCLCMMYHTCKVQNSWYSIEIYVCSYNRRVRLCLCIFRHVQVFACRFLHWIYLTSIVTVYSIVYSK